MGIFERYLSVWVGLGIVVFAFAPPTAFLLGVS